MHDNSEQFDQFLSDYQLDLKKIIGKHRFSFHHLDETELLSEINLAIFKKKEALLEEWGDTFCRTEFNKLAYNYARNSIKWTQGRLNKKKYFSRRSDNVIQTQDGVKTTFEVAVETAGYEEDYYESFDGLEKYKFLLKFIKDYAHILTPTEIKVLSLLEKGMRQDDIAEECGITRQAISACCIDMFEKIRLHLGSNVLEDNGFDLVRKGNESIKAFFTEDLREYTSEEEKVLLEKILKENPKTYTVHDLAETFMGGKYGFKKILALTIHLQLTFYLKKTNPVKFPFSRALDKEILKLFKDGKSCNEVSLLLNIPVYSVMGKRGHFTRSGALKGSTLKEYKRKYHLSSEERGEILRLFLEGKNSREVSSITQIPTNSVRATRGALSKKGLLDITPDYARKKIDKSERVEST